jgi:serine/threonine protein kinase
VLTDVKPENIFVARKPLSVGAEEVVKVLDFGIARVLGRKTRVTSTQTALGTPHYMAPETLQGEEATTQSDVYAVGVILTEMLTGKLPWGESSRSDVSAVMARMVSQPHRLSALLPGTRHPPDLQPALDQFLSQQLEDRPVDCAVALHILLQLSSPSGTSLPPAASSISLPPLSDSRPGPITLPAPDSSPLVETPSQERATRPMRSATAVMNSHRSQHTSDRSRWLVVVLAMVGSLVTLWLFKAKVRSLPKSPALAAAIAPAPQRRLFVPDGATTAEPPPAGEPTEPRKTEPLKPEPVPQVAKPSPDKSKRPSRGHREKPVDPPNLAFPLDTKGY